MSAAPRLVATPAAEPTAMRRRQQQAIWIFAKSTAFAFALGRLPALSLYRLRCGRADQTASRSGPFWNCGAASPAFPRSILPVHQRLSSFLRTSRSASISAASCWHSVISHSEPIDLQSSSAFSLGGFLQPTGLAAAFSRFLRVGFSSTFVSIPSGFGVIFDGI